MAKRTDSDEAYIIGLCDKVLGEKALRGHRFPFLLGDAGKRGTIRLPVDAFYPGHNIVIEYYERQHDEAIRHFDKPDRMTVSGVHRGEQRRIYDQRRRDELPKHGIRLVILHYHQFAHSANKRLKRIASEDIKVIQTILE